MRIRNPVRPKKLKIHYLGIFNTIKDIIIYDKISNLINNNI